ncbi:MAG: GGDEF domain-containing protein [Treponema sp.]|nr:GGDEF domain-containing protein [Treponema sp.]
MSKFIDKLRFYTFEQEQYAEFMKNIFYSNLLALRKASAIFAIFTFGFAFFSIIFEPGIFKGLVCFGFAAFALIIHIAVNYMLQLLNIKKWIIYALIIVYFTVLMLFAVTISVWLNVNSGGALHTIILACSLLMFINSLRFNFILLFFGALFVIICSIIWKEFEFWIYDLVNTLIAGSLGMFFTWQFTKLRLGLEVSTSILEDEKNKYLDQSIVDELTGLKNRRDFMQTFQRYVTNYRTSDDWFCIAIADIDFFKNYNDFYGHQKGDDCLRSVGKMLSTLSDNLGIYVSRVGGEEFAAIWFEKESSHVDKVMAAWADAVKKMEIRHEKSTVSDFLTMSIGVYKVRCGPAHDVKNLYNLADQALYTAKNSGRNRAVVHGDDIKQYEIPLK